MITLPAKLALIPSSDESSRKVWRAGTITYTTGGLGVLFFWLLWGDFAWSVKERAIPAVVQLLMKNFGASDMVAGFLLGSLPPAIGIMLVPIISYKSDRHRGRWGRRIPFLLFPTPVVVLALVGLAFSPVLGADLDRWLGAHSFGRNPCTLMVLGLSWMLFEFATVTANALYGALINDTVPRQLLGRFYGLFRALSLVAAILFFFGFSADVEKHSVLIFLGVAALYGFGFTVMCLKVKEGEYPPRPAMDTGRNTAGFFRSARAYFKECFGHSYYWWFFGTSTLSAVASGPVNLFSLYFAKSLQMSTSSYFNYLALTYCISLALAYPLGWLADRFHPLRMNIAIVALYALVALLGGIFAVNPSIFGFFLVAHGVVTGSWATCTASMGQRLLPKGEFAQFSSAGGMILSFGFMFLAPAVGFFLDCVHHHYRYTFFIGFVLAIAALLASLVLHRKFMALGGPDNYLAPEQ
jgi:MFS family permease